jgi:hypothetical protein
VRNAGTHLCGRGSYGGATALSWGGKTKSPRGARAGSHTGSCVGVQVHGAAVGRAGGGAAVGRAGEGAAVGRAGGRGARAGAALRGARTRGRGRIASDRAV